MNKLLDSLDHITIITKNLKKTTDFYINILGMKLDNKRPPFNFDGAWLSLNNRAVVHIVVNNNHITNNNKNGALGLLNKCIPKFEQYLPSHREIDVRYILDQVDKSIVEVNNIESMNQFNWKLVPKIKR